MADLLIVREHTLGFAAARNIAVKWVEQAQGEFGMACTYTQGDALDEVCFSRAGVQGSLKVSHDAFELQAKLGFLLSAFKVAIETEIAKNLELLLAPHLPDISEMPDTSDTPDTSESVKAVKKTGR